jgi:glycosyltransferase involved in cell wall biosynthesis
MLADSPCSRFVRKNEVAEEGRAIVRRRMKRLVIDARWLVGGIGTYVRQLLAGLSHEKRDFEVHAIVRRQDVDLVAQWCDRVTVVDTRIYTLREQLEVPWAARGCDLLHVPHYNAPLLHRGPLLLSIHDLIHVTHPTYRNGVKAWAYARPVLIVAARKATHIVAVSEYSKTQIVVRAGVPASKVTTIHNGVGENFSGVDKVAAFHAVSRFTGVRTPYILYVGSLKPYKNVSGLLRAYGLLRARREIREKLLIVGDDSTWKRDLLEECRQLGMCDLVCLVSQVPAELLPQVYAAAELLVMPSTIEGFGFPVLEAMASGTPVISSKAASLPEVGGNAVLYFDSADDRELADAIEQLLLSKDLRESLRRRGIEQAKRFTLKESTRKHVELYRSLLALQ